MRAARAVIIPRATCAARAARAAMIPRALRAARAAVIRRAARAARTAERSEMALPVTEGRDNLRRIGGCSECLTRAKAGGNECLAGSTQFKCIKVEVWGFV